MHDPGDENDYAAMKRSIDRYNFCLGFETGRLKFDEIVGHPNLSKAINDKIANSALAGGAHITRLPPEKRGYRVVTANTTYHLVRHNPGLPNQTFWTIDGHPKYCPLPVVCNIHGSTWGGSMLKVGFIGRGMHLEVGLIVDGQAQVLTTSPILEVEEI